MCTHGKAPWEMEPRGKLTGPNGRQANHLGLKQI